MFDYKYNSINGITPNELLNNSLLEFTTNLNLKTGELIAPENSIRRKTKFKWRDLKLSYYNQCEFSIANDTLIHFSGSIHQYFNNGTNENDFYFNDLINAIKDIHDKFNINPVLSELHNIEFGVNVILPFRTKTFLDSIISMKGREYERRKYNGKGYLIRFSFDQFEIKIYDKGKQRNLKENLLRFEIKVTTMNFLHDKEINLHTDRDLLNSDIHLKLGELLSTYFNKIVFYDNSINLNEVRPHEEKILINGRNPKYWSELKDTEPENYKKRLPRYRELIAKYGKVKMHETVLKLITEKWKQLTNLTPETEFHLNEYLLQLETKTFPKITNTKKENFPYYNPLNSNLLSGKIEETEKRFCLSCGRDISNQKKGSKFCSEKIYGAEVKRCRNINSNPRNNFKNREQKIFSKGLLFFIEPDAENLK